MKPNTTEQVDSAMQIIRRQVDTAFLTRGRVVVVGLGGIGSYVIRPLSILLEGLCRTSGPGITIQLLVCDGDSFAPENAYRMDVPQFGNKAEVIGRELLERSDVGGLIIRWQSDFVKPENVCEVIQEGDCVLLAVDNHATRRLVSQRCSGGDLDNVVLISGGNDGIEDGLRGSYGNVQVYIRRDGSDLTAPLDRFHPEIAVPQDKSPADLSCQELVVAGVPQFGFVNLAVASAMCNTLLRLMMPGEQGPMYDEVALDIYDAVMTPHWLS